MYRPNVIASYCACSVWKPINKTIPREEQKKHRNTTVSNDRRK